MERANLKERNKDIYERLVSEWNEWNVTMLQEVAESSTDNFTGGQLADLVAPKKQSRMMVSLALEACFATPRTGW
jgi:hypothetical protein